MLAGEQFTIPTRHDILSVCTRNTRAVKLHDQNSLWWDPLCSLGLPALIASCWGDALAGFLVAGALRWLVVQHFTFFVNSVAHGEPRTDEHRFDARMDSIGPRTSLLVTMCALGEGWHDYHHAFPWDYAAAELDAWDQWNPTKFFIDCCYHLGLCDDRIRCTRANQLARRRQLEARAEGQKASLPMIHDGSEAGAALLGTSLNVDRRVQKSSLYQHYEVVGWPFLRACVKRARVD